MTERKRITITTVGAYDGPGEAIIVDAEYDPLEGRVVVFDLDGNEIARANVTPGDDAFFIAQKLVPRSRKSDFWRAQLNSSRVPY